MHISGKSDTILEVTRRGKYTWIRGWKTFPCDKLKGFSTGCRNSDFSDIGVYGRILFIVIACILRLIDACDIL